MAKVFSNIENAMPSIIKELQKTYPNDFKNTEYILYPYTKRGLVGLNFKSDSFPSSLFWIDENLDVRACFGSLSRDEKYRVLNKEFQNILNVKLKQA